ncbi:hypothetical protein CON65_09470 [Bacillus pseudomycoides]|uniref:Uncharacterized protein n=1 Tax=Bacillus pseudomycoides TaxID=64104 RepID=A0AA91VD85_9BACI|nr:MULTISPECIES: hypothetical protein [Bacillus]PEB48011.1 hypothetical protein COO03_24800 [Bacillus sp. AFS098217]PED82889.1 hypothetical protein CON65_09470 [Bacillus pseudomycoides]PEU09726.1 hypothetical protein CN524_17995 [Bacillus sp. AFS019443]PEU18421.1 hypothetical protein CN525_11795 [Bacillus sp. AFS014408]PFW62665.1 hypothetical protein COL20_12145 [Bacillus sp. AFS075034]
MLAMKEIESSLDRNHSKPIEKFKFDDLRNSIHTLFPDYKKNDYRLHSSFDIDTRMRVASPFSALVALYDGVGIRQRSVLLEKLTNFILADDFNQGVMLTDRPREKGTEKSEYVPLGEGARKFRRLEDGLTPLTDKELQRIKKCEVCEGKFIDESRAGNAKICGESCRRIKDSTRKRKEYNRAEHNIEGEGRYMRDWRRQQLDYTFYSPYELNHIGDYNELKSDEIEQIVSEVKSEFAMNDQRKPGFNSMSELEGSEDYKELSEYVPRFGKKKHDIRWGTVTTYSISELEEGKCSERYTDAGKCGDQLREIWSRVS